MAQQSFCDLLANDFAAQAAITGTATETTLHTPYSIPANYLTPGKKLRLRLLGVYTSAASSQGTLTYKVHMGTAGTNADLVLCGSPAITVPASGSNTGWNLEAHISCWAAGATGNTVIALGVAEVVTVTTGVPIKYSMHGAAGATAPAAVAVNTTVANLLSAYATFSSATTNTMQALAYALEELN